MAEDLNRGVSEGTGAEVEGAEGASSTGEMSTGAAFAGAEGAEVLIGHANVLIARPGAGQTVQISAELDRTYVFDFDPATAQVSVEGDNLVLTFADGGRIVIQGLGKLTAEPDAPTFVIAGTEIEAGPLFSQAVALSEAGPEATATLEVAAGGTIPSGGVGLDLAGPGDPLDLLDAQGVIAPVERVFGLANLDVIDPIFSPPNTPPSADPVLTLADSGPLLPPDLSAALAALAAPGGGGGGVGGGIFITGHDSEEHRNGDYMTAGLDFLAFGHAATGAEVAARGDLTVAFLNPDFDSGAIAAMEANGWVVTFFDLDSDFSAAFTSGFDLIMVGSGDGSSAHRDALFAAKDQFADFINEGGGLYINTDEGFGQTWYDFVPSFGTALNNNIFDSGVFTVTDEGLLIGLTDSIVDRDITHSFFTGVDTSLFTVFEVTDESFGEDAGIPVAFGARNIGISGDEFVAAADIAFFKQLTVDGVIGDSDDPQADFGGLDAETPLSELIFTLTSPPNYGFLILVTAGGTTTEMAVGDTFTSADTVWWVATESQVNDFLKVNGLQQLPDATFDYSVTDADGNVATAPVTITPPEILPPVANPDEDMLQEGFGGEQGEGDFGNFTTGNVLTGDPDPDSDPINQGVQLEDTAGSAGGPLTIVSVEHDGTVHTDAGDGSEDGFIVFSTALGGFFQIDVNTGDYTYFAPVGGQDHSQGPVTEVFTYTIEDPAGLTDSTDLTIEIKDTVPVGGETAIAVDEDDIPVIGNSDEADGDDLADPSPVVINGFLDFTPGADAVTVGFDAMNGVVQNVGNSTLSYSWDAGTNTLTANDGAVDVFTVEVTNTSTGAYTFTLLAPLSHPVAGTEDNLTVNLTYTITDSDGDSDTGVLSIDIDDDSPVASIAAVAEAMVTIDETAGLDDDDTTDAAVIALFAGVSTTGTDGGLPQFARSATAVVTSAGSAAGADDEGATTVISLAIVGGDGTFSGLTTTDGIAIDLFLENGLIVGRLASGPDTGDAAFAIALESDGKVSVAQYLSLFHPDSPDNFDEAVDLSGLVNAVVTVTDGDGDVATDTVAIGDLIKFDDDGPLDITAMPALVANSGDAVGSGDLNFLGTIGADEPGDVVFVNNELDNILRDTGGTALTTTSGFAILLDGFGTHTLTAWADLDGNGIDAGDTMVFTIELLPGSDDYTITFFDTIDDGSAREFVFSGLSPGNDLWFGLEDGIDPVTGLSMDILATGIVVGTDNINISQQGLGTGSQALKGGEGLRFDFVTGLQILGAPEDVSPLGNPDDISTMEFVSHYTVNEAGFRISQTQAGNLASASVQVFELNVTDEVKDANDFILTTTGQTALGIIGVVVTDGTNVLEEAVWNTTTMTFDIVGTDNPDVVITGTGGGGGSDNTEVTVDGLLVGYQVFIETNLGFDRLEVFNAADSKPSFDISGITIGSSVAGSDVVMDFDLQVSDADGDTAAGTLAMTMVPDGGATITGTGADEALIGGSGGDTLEGAGGADILTGGGGADIFVYTSLSDGVDTITDFDVTNGGTADDDVLELSDLFTDGTVNSGNVDTFVQVSGGTLQVDPTGTSTFSTTLANLTGVTAGDILQVSIDGEDLTVTAS